MEVAILREASSFEESSEDTSHSGYNAHYRVKSGESSHISSASSFLRVSKPRTQPQTRNLGDVYA